MIAKLVNIFHEIRLINTVLSLNGFWKLGRREPRDTLQCICPNEVWKKKCTNVSSHLLREC